MNKKTEKIISIKKEYEEELLKISKVVGVLAKEETMCIFVEDAATCQNIPEKIYVDRDTIGVECVVIKDVNTLTGLKNEFVRLLLYPERLPGLVGIGYSGGLTSDGKINFYIESDAFLSSFPSKLIYKNSLIKVKKQVTGPFSMCALSRRGKNRPFFGGISVGNFDDATRTGATGTLGIITYDEPAKILSNAHILAYNGFGDEIPLGSMIMQPGVIDSGFSLGNQVGELLDYIAYDFKGVNYADAAIASTEVKGSILSSYPGKILYSDDTTFIVLEGIDDANIGDSVVWSGRTSGWATAEVYDIYASVYVDFKGNTLFFEDQIILDKAALPGDSGSVVFKSSNNKTIGLVFASSKSRATVCKIEYVLKKLDVRLTPPNYGTFVINTRPIDADIYIDGVDTTLNTNNELVFGDGRKCGAVSCELGTYIFTLKKQFYKDHVFSKTIADGDDIIETITLSPVSGIDVGSIEVSTNLVEASYSIKGPVDYIGDGKSWSVNNALIGKYTIYYNDVILPPSMPNYVTPPSETRELKKGETIIFKGEYIDVNDTFGSLTINTIPTGAKIFLFGIDTGLTTNTTLFFGPKQGGKCGLDDCEYGDNEFTLKLSGYEDYSFIERIEMFDEKERNITLKKINKPGYLSVDSSPQGVYVYIG